MKVYTVADNIISPLGFTTSQNFAALKKQQSGIRKISAEYLLSEGFYGAAIDQDIVKEQLHFQTSTRYSYLENLFLHSISSILKTVPGINKSRMLLIISTTKGNIDLIGTAQGKEEGGEKLGLAAMARTVNSYFKIPNEPLVVSNACISGVSAIIIGSKLIRMGMYDHVVVSGGDILSKFTLAGFQSLKAISDEPCRPYDAERKGINLGEACGSVLLSRDVALCSERNSFSRLLGGGQSNDANHISGPSRTGKGLKIAIAKALQNAGRPVEQLDYINAHGTATLFNDEMEAIAFHDLGLGKVPVNSLKGYFGHTLGAAGIVETIITIWQMNQNLLLKSFGYENEGVSKSIQIIKEHTEADQLQVIMKTVSGFGGCNAALIMEKG